MAPGTCYTRIEFAAELKIDPKTFRKLVERNGIILPNGLITPAKATEIRRVLGIRFDTDEDKSANIRIDF